MTYRRLSIYTKLLLAMLAVMLFTGEETICYVQDNGIDPQYHDKVFGLFERLESAPDGTGIDRALVKCIIEVHGGHLWVESAGQGQGSTFCFTLPHANGATYDESKHAR